MLVVGDGLGLVGLSGHQRRTCLVAVLTGVVKTGLSLSQLSRLSARQRARVCPVPLLEMLNGAFQLACFVQLDAIFFQLVQRFGDVAEQLRRQRRERLGERMGQARFVGLLRQLGLAQLNQGIHQRFIALGTQLEQALVDSSAIAMGILEDLAPPLCFNRIAQTFSGENHSLFAGQPDVLADAGVFACRSPFEDEEPALHLRLARGCGQACSQREVAVRAVRHSATEFDPGVADAALIAAHQQVPSHLLAVVAIWLDPRGSKIRIEEKRQGQRKHLGLTCAVVAAQEQMAVPEPELFTVVVEQLNQAEPERLPALTQRLRQRWTQR